MSHPSPALRRALSALLLFALLASLPTAAFAAPAPQPGPLADAAALYRASDFAGAEAAYRAVLDGDADDVAALTGLAWGLLYVPGREADALAAAEQAAELAPDDIAAQTALAMALLWNDRLEEAQATAELAVSFDPEDAGAQAALAFTDSALHADEWATEAAETAVTLDPENAFAWSALAQMHWNAADFARSVAAVERAVELEPGFAPWRIHLGDSYGALQQYNRAVEQYDAALDLAPGYLPALSGKVQAAIRQHRFADAAFYAAQVVESAPDLPLGYTLQADVALAERRLDDARTGYEAALEGKAGDAWALNGLAWAALQSGDCDLVADAAARHEAALPFSTHTPILLGFAELCSGDARRALRHFEDAVEMDPAFDQAHEAIGVAYAEQGRGEQAVAAWVDGLAVSAAPAAFHTYLGGRYAQDGLPDDARAEYEAALRLDPLNVQALAELGGILLAPHLLDERLELAQRALDIDPADAAARLVMGSTLVLRGEAQEAVALLEQAIAEQPDATYEYYWLALARRDLGDYDGALAAIEEFASYVTAEEAQSVTFLLGALEQGWAVRERKALADIADAIEGELGKAADVTVQATDEGTRTLTIAYAADLDADEAAGLDAHEQEAAIADAMGTALIVGAFLAPRMEPGVSLVRVATTLDGAPAYTAEMDAADAADLVDGLLVPADLGAAVRFTRLGESTARPLEEIAGGVAALRELEFGEEVPVEVLTPVEFAAGLEEISATDAATVTLVGDALLTTLGVLQPGDDLEALLTNLTAEQTAGYYDSATGTLHIISDGEQSATDEMTAAHEYVHALQDQAYGLDATTEGMNSDAALAFRALAEGDATLAMLLYASEQMAVFDIFSALGEVSGLDMDALDAVPAFISRAYSFPYVEGTEFAGTLYDQGGWEAVAEAYAAPPASTEQVLHPERYRAGEGYTEVELPEFAGEWQEVDRDLFGELGLRLLLAEYGGPALAARAAEGWDGDQYVLLQAGEAGPDALVLRTLWDDEDEAQEFFALLRAAMRQRPGYAETVTQLTGELSERRWQGEADAVHAAIQGQAVTVVIAPDAAALDELAP